MSRSGLTYIFWDNHGVRWGCSDSSLFESVLAELTKLVPGCKIKKNVSKQTFGAPVRSKIEKLGGDDLNVAWWIVKQLCEKGWEPFDVSGTSGNAGFGHFFLRLVGRAD